LYDNILKTKEYLDKYNLERLEELLPDTEYNFIEKRNKVIIFIEDIFSTTLYAKERRNNDHKVTPEKWYELNGEYAKKVDWNVVFQISSINNTHNTYRYDVLIAYILLLVKLKKIDDLLTINIDIWNLKIIDWEYYTNLIGYSFLNIYNMEKYNSNYLFGIIENISEQEKKEFYQFIDKKIVPKLNDINIIYMQIPYYIYNNPKFDLLLLQVKKRKSNKEYWTEKGKPPKKYTDRLSELMMLFSYLVMIDNKEEIVKLFNKFITGLKIASEEMKHILSEINQIGKRNDNFKILRKKLISMLPVKEAVIFDYDLFVARIK
jgi:hypothetical protein